jgi:hypothetical protein
MSVFEFLSADVNRRAALGMNVGRRYRCQNPDCRCEIVVLQASKEAVNNPRCCCGAEMKKRYKKPTFEKLDFTPVEFAELVKMKG